MNKKFMAIALASVLAGTLCSFNSASAQRFTTPNDAEDTSGVTQNAIGGADAPGVRLAAFIDGNLGGGTVVRSKGVASFTSPATGLFCIRPSSGINVNNIVPIVSVEQSKSLANDNLVQYRSNGSGCPNGNIAVATFRFNNTSDASGNKFVQADGIAFTIIVP
ncbi:hypothetical protein G7B40_006125 [Aetokthonos hydrillicola Thurmond2011]|jgi:hypothetical protein|uniref:Uncharacterized protein n=2 Tax=Aetokthonos TaxID=1550243 RepID=A0AAP5I6M5_9CYAN|nr:hypothetical protein [Aetokthonos hydrillicola]MBO3462210.1 hypothetical protein [Aetokthonos hydrillicola CCALA 1050]MBW4585092.1 hypothetical protein [Aetokthonos hydrillicola CCALA 1050]MDR9894148.1 hypothetical protein [Aetokthonos hydrillicola Thurmond2011]